MIQTLVYLGEIIIKNELEKAENRNNVLGPLSLQEKARQGRIRRCIPCRIIREAARFEDN